MLLLMPVRYIIRGADNKLWLYRNVPQVIPQLLGLELVWPARPDLDPERREDGGTSRLING